MTTSGAEQVRAQALEVAAGWATPDAPASWPLAAALFGVIAGDVVDALPGVLASLDAPRVIVTAYLAVFLPPEPLIDAYRRNGVFAVLGARTFDAGTGSARLLARAHPSGRWVEWQGPGTTWNG
jgi:hypothetical protein